MAGIEIRGLTKSFRDGSRALEGVDLDVADGELLVLVGPSGSGKTTLLRLIAGLDQPTDGTIHVGGIDLAGVPPHKRDVALVFQNLALYGHLCVADNLAFGQENKAESGKRKVEGRVQEAARLLGIERLLQRYPAELSGGEQQRVALGRAIVRQPAALLLDEPLSSLDGPARRVLRRELKRLQRELGVPTIYVTHDQAEAMALGDRIAVLDQGQLQQVASPHDVYRRPANRFVAEFFGPQGMNLIEGELESRGDVDGLCGDNVSVIVPSKQWPTDALIDGPVLLGIRPEDIEVLPNDADSSYSAVGDVEFIEEIGNLTYAHVRLHVHDLLPATIDAEPKMIVVQLSEESRDRLPGEKIRLRFRGNRLHWF